VQSVVVDPSNRLWILLYTGAAKFAPPLGLIGHYWMLGRIATVFRADLDVAVGRRFMMPA
jgi:hypothetical protein